MGRLTVRAIESAKGQTKEYKLSDGEGLQVRVAPDGVKTWLVRYMLDGKERQYTLPRAFGGRTDGGHLSLDDARHESAMIRAKARKGIDYPTEQAQERKADEAEQERERVASLGVRELYTEWMRDGIDHKDGGAELKRRMEKDVLPAIGDKQVRAVIESDILQIMRKVVARGAPNMAIKILNAVKQMFGWGEERLPWRRLIEVNPAGSIDPDKVVGRSYEEGANTRPLAPHEIPELRDRIKAMHDDYENADNKRTAPQPLEKRTELAIWIMLSTCCRVGEIGRARRAAVNLDKDEWTIPPEHSKNEDAQIVYLSDFAKRQFQELLALEPKSVWLFPSPKNPAMHVDVKSITKQIGDRQLAKSNRDPAKNRTKAANALMLSGGGWTPHDLRRTGSTFLESLGVLPPVIDKVLNHREPNKLRRTYLRYDYENEKREAWRLLGERLDLLNRTDAGNVVVLKSSA